MKKVEKLFTRPVLVDHDGDLTKKWYVYFSVCDPQTSKMIPIKKYSGINTCDTITQRRMAGDILCREWNARLESGWMPGCDDICVYKSELDYYELRKNDFSKKLNIRSYHYLASEFLKNHVKAKGLRRKTYMDYQSKLRTFGFWLDEKKIGNADIAAVTNDVVKEFFAYLVIEKKYFYKTIVQYKLRLKSFFAYIYINGNNPVRDIVLPVKRSTGTNRPFTKQDSQAIVDLMKETDPQLWLASQFVVYCFIRCGAELRNMRCRWIDFNTGKLTVPGEFDKKNKERIKIIPNHFFKALKSIYHIDKYAPDDYVLSKSGTPGPNILAINELGNRYRALRTKLDLPKTYTLYSFKPTGMIMASDAGVPVKHIQQQAGHESLDYTDIYLSKVKGFESENLRNQFPEI